MDRLLGILEPDIAFRRLHRVDGGQIVSRCQIGRELLDHLPGNDLAPVLVGLDQLFLVGRFLDPAGLASGTTEQAGHAGAFVVQPLTDLVLVRSFRATFRSATMAA